MTAAGGYPSLVVLTESGVCYSTYYRHLIRLEREGLIQRSIRRGGPGGTRSMILYRGSLLQLLDLVRHPPAKQPDRRVCPTCGHGVPMAMWVETIREQVRRELQRPQYPFRDQRSFRGEKA